MSVTEVALASGRLLVLAVAVGGTAFVSTEVGQAGDLSPQTILPVTALLLALITRPASRAADKVAHRIVLGKRKDPGRILDELAKTLRSSVAPNELIHGVLSSFASTVGAAHVSIWRRMSVDEFVVAYSSRPEIIEWARSDLSGLEGKLFEIKGSGGSQDHYLWIQGRTLTPPEIEMTQDVVAQLSIAINNSKLIAMLEAKLAELTIAEQHLKDLRRKIVETQESERRRLERDLHDGAQQYLIGLGIRLRIAAESGVHRPDELRHNIQEALRINFAAVRSLEGIAGEAFLRQSDLVRLIQETTQLLPIQAEFTNALGREFAPPAVNAALFCCLEALQNTVKHSRAETVRIRLWDDGGLRFLVEDDGVGFDVSNASAGFGLMSLRNRLAEAGGALEVSSARGAGTRVEGWIPNPEEGQ